MTHTVATLEVPPDVFELIKQKLSEAGYDHAFMRGGEIDMSGIALVPNDKAMPWHLSRDSKVAVADHEFMPIGDDTPRGAKVILCTAHHVAIVGAYQDERRTPGIKGWFPVPGIPAAWKSAAPPYVAPADTDAFWDRPDLAA